MQIRIYEVGIGKLVANIFFSFPSQQNKKKSKSTISFYFQVIYLNLVMTDKGPDVVPECSTAEVEKHLKCGCACAIKEEDCNEKQVSHYLLSAVFVCLFFQKKIHSFFKMRKIGNKVVDYSGL